VILGADVRADQSVLEGVEFPDNDPPAWVSSVADGVRPYPEGLDTRPIPVDGNLKLAVVWVPPTPTPPCNAHGTVYERVSGRTVSVREPLRLAQLFARGDGAHRRALEFARSAAACALELGAARWPANGVRLSLGLCAAGHAPDISSRLFSPEFWSTMEATVPQYRDPHVQTMQLEHRQDTVIASTIPRAPGETMWLARSAWKGSVALACRIESQFPRFSTVMEHIEKAWKATGTLMGELQPVGATYLSVRFEGELFGEESKTGQLDRGPIGRAVDAGLLPGIERELKRFAGETAFEENVGPQADG
jgi:hypothetical protein